MNDIKKFHDEQNKCIMILEIGKYILITATKVVNWLINKLN